MFLADELPTWILGPDDLPFGEGIYYLRVVPKDDLESTSGRNLTVGITTFLSHCVFWDESQETWDTSGCQVRKTSKLGKLGKVCPLLWGPHWSLWYNISRFSVVICVCHSCARNVLLAFNCLEETS